MRPFFIQSLRHDAEQIIAAQVGTIKLSLAKGAGNDNLLLGPTPDARLREIAV